MTFKDLFTQFYIEKATTIKQRVGYNSNYDNIVTKRMPDVLDAQLKRKDLLIKPSVGMTQYAYIPWICLISSNPRIARNAQKGIYVVMLFNKTGDSFYLCLGQGFTHFKDISETSKQRDKLIFDTVQYFQNEIGIIVKTKYGFSIDPIDLGHDITDLGKGYIQTTVLSKRYNVDDFNEKDFYESLDAIISEYDDIIMHFGGKSYDEVIDIITSRSNFESLDVALENIEKSIKDNFVEIRDVNLTPIQVEKGDIRTNKYLKIRQSVIRKKADYLKLARDNYQTGTLGERLALRIERDRLLKLGLDPDKHVVRVSIESDNYGYDIESVDYINGKLTKIFIEVKSTKDITDSSFFVSKNELEVSKQKGSLYRLLRIYDLTSIAPKYYFADGYIEENFYLDPSTYNATYKYKVC